MELVLYLCGSQILIICSLTCLFARRWLWSLYSRETSPPSPRFNAAILALGLLFLIGSFGCIWLASTLA